MPWKFILTPIHVVVGIIFNSEQYVLIAKRQAHQEKGGMWEFPGGKVEHRESTFEALRRELKEEISINVTQAEPLMQVTYDYPHKSVLLDTWIIKSFNGIPVGAEGQAIKWQKVHELTQLEFPEGNRPIIQKLVEMLDK